MTVAIPLHETLRRLGACEELVEQAMREQYEQAMRDQEQETPR